MADSANPTRPANPASKAASLEGLRIDRSAAPKHRRRPRWLLWLLLAAGVLVVAALFWRPRATEVVASSVLSTTPSQQHVELTASGFVVAQRRAAVSSKATGRLIELTVREGSRVKTGELIGRLDAADAQAAVAAAQAGVAQALASRGQTDAASAQAHAEIRRAQAEAANAEAEFRRQQDLVRQGFVSTQAVDAAERRLQTARATVDWARAAAAAATAAIQGSRATEAQAQAQLKVQQVQRSHTEIRAPFDGVVLVKNANVGDMITPFSSAAGTSGAVVTMADLGTLEVEADVSESNVARLKVGQPVEITLDALPNTRLRGSVAGIVPTVDRAKATVMTKLRFDKLDPRILPEMSAKVAFLSRPASEADMQSVLAVNSKAIVDRDGRKWVLRINGNQVEAIAVTPGRMLGEIQELLNPTLKSGERLVLSPPATLQSGDAIMLKAK